MTPYEAVGWSLINTTAISAIVGSTNIWHGLRPKTTTLPCINYYELGTTRHYGWETAIYSINCRSATAGGARDLARLVVDLFHGTSGSGIWGDANGFAVGRASLQNDAGVIPEPDDVTFNSPVDITIVYPSQTVS